MKMRRLGRRPNQSWVLVALVIASVGIIGSLAAAMWEKQPPPNQNVMYAIPSNSNSSSPASTTHASESSTQPPDTTLNWTVAIVSATIGALLTVTAERLYEGTRENKALRNHLTIVNSEIKKQSDIAVTRSGRKLDDPFPFDQPLSISSWNGLLASGTAWKLLGNPDTFTKIDSFYSAVITANQCNQFSQKMFELSQQTGVDGSAKRMYLDKAMQMSITPYVAVVENGKLALQSAADGK